ncbi:MAG: helix-turn-helix transcriptional regulator [Treponema sp.]|nr:helix-turn-helix transcriptional regulator [Treponema sp.]MCL2272931.1 helix-turn-helix transcriptional regulator [Treponema sp.]
MSDTAVKNGIEKTQLSGAQLTPREQEIFNLLLEGVPPKEIANRINITYNAVDKRRTKLYRKLGVKGINELLARYTVQQNFDLIKSLSLASTEKPFIITLADNAPVNFSLDFYPFVNKNIRITAGDTFTFYYTFTSNTDLGVLFISFSDISQGDYKHLAPYVHLKGDVKANTEYSGQVTIIAGNTASNTDSNANLVNIGTYPYAVKQPTITFTEFKLEQANLRNN